MRLHGGEHPDTSLHHGTQHDVAVVNVRVTSLHALELKNKPLWHEVAENDRLMFFQRISMAATRCVNRKHDMAFDDLSVRMC